MELMFVIVFTLSFLTILIVCPIPNDLKFSNVDCYRSFSDPEIFLRLHHYNPTGPQYFVGRFQLIVNTLNETFSYINFDKKIHFKKIKRLCGSNIKFSTKGKDITEMIIIVRISLSTSQFDMAFMFYEFQRGFKQDDYLLVDHRENYAIEVKVSTYKEQFFEKLDSDIYEDDARYYINSISSLEGELCVVTPNNRNFIIPPTYDILKPKGFITRIRAEFKYIGYYRFTHWYSAFECDINNFYPNEQKIFISEGFQSSDLYLSITYIKYVDDDLIEYEVPFSIPGLVLNDYITSLSFPSTFKTIFFMKVKQGSVICPDQSRISVYLSEFDCIYYAQSEVNVHVVPYVRKKSYVNINPLIPCG